MIKPLSCPICQKVLPVQEGQASSIFPFCSERCKNVDLLRWSDGKYAIVEDLSQRPDVLLEAMEKELSEEELDHEGY